MTQGRRSEPPGSGRRSRSPAHGGPPRASARAPRSAADRPNGLFAEMLRASRELLAVRSPLDAELMVSELLGTWWEQVPAGTGRRGVRRRRAEIEELIGEGLVAYAAEQGSPAALALLSGIACLGTPRQAAQAEQAALALMERGVARPGWAEHVGAVAAGDCYVNGDPFGDRDELVCVFSYAGQEQHALVVIVDYNAGGIARDGWVTSQVDKLLELTSGGGSRFGPVAAPQARRTLEAALSAVEAAQDPPVSDSFPSYHAFIRARVRTLPPARSPDAAARRSSWRRDRRAALVAEFLASDEAEDLSDLEAASRCADHIVDYGCDQDFGRPLRVSPVKAETFLLDWLPRKVMLRAAEQHAMPHVLDAWVRWAGARSGLAADAVGATLDAVYDSMGTFTRVYRDPASFGLEPELVARLLPDAALEALPRRAFAFPVLRGNFQGTDLGALDPAAPGDRRKLLAADHADLDASQGGEQHIDQHLALADRLWRGEPAELWEAAQRLLDAGQDRHAVLHTLMDVLDAAGGSQPRLITALAALPPEEPAG